MRGGSVARTHRLPETRSRDRCTMGRVDVLQRCVDRLHGLPGLRTGKRLPVGRVNV